MNQELIEKALKLTEKTMEDVTIWVGITMDFFSIEKFCYYLLSPEFMIRYIWILWLSDFLSERYNVWLFWNAIYQFQSWDEKLLIALLSKI